MMTRENPSELRAGARKIAQDSKEPGRAWSELRSWAAGKGPLAMRTAAMEFISVHGRNPQALLLMPEVLKSSAGFISPPTLSDRMISLRPDVPRMQPSLNFGPKPLEARTQVQPMRLNTSMELPRRPDHAVQFDATKSPDSRVMGATSHGHHIVRSLIHSLKSHAADPHTHEYQGEPMKKKAKSKKMTKKKPVKKSKKKSRKR